MDFILNIDLKKLPVPITYGQKIMLIGSCFTEHIGTALSELKFDTLQNPNGILFGPDAVCKSLLSYASNQQYTDEDLFQLNEVWHSWNHHSRFSHTNREQAVHTINTSQQKAHDFLRQSDWLIITLGSSFSYELTGAADTASGTAGNAVANCHRAPSSWFTKKMLETDTIIHLLGNCLKELKEFNPGLRFIFTISPVRHIRDGVIENNRSKARLIEAVHSVVAKFEGVYYFPAYELVIDILRDYRFYDIDLVHPNYPATEFVMEKFTATCVDEESQQLMKKIRSIIIARKHKAFQPDTNAHKQFLAGCLEKTKELQRKYPFLELEDELRYFSSM